MRNLGKLLKLPFFFIKKLNTHFNAYKSTNQKQKLPLLNYVIWLLFYRRFLCYVIALPLFVLYFILYPFIRFRFCCLIDSAIGHYTVNTECFLSKLDTLKDDKFINIFYLEHSLFAPPICNDYLHTMWKRIIYILPLSLTGIATSLDRMLMYFLGNKAYGLWGEKAYFEKRGAVRDVYGYLKNSPPHLKFTQEEHQLAQQLLEQINIKPNDRYICLLVRSSAYNKDNPSWSMLPDRNSNLSTYIKSCHWLAEKGYFVLRMGKIVDDTLEANHPKIIDYATSKIRSDFMDIYLSAHCYFFITTGSGLDGVPQVFQKPILCTNWFIASHIDSWYPHYVFIPKLAAFKESNKLLSFKEDFRYLCDNDEFTDPSFHYFYSAEYIKKHGFCFIDNTEDEILEVVEEMEARVTGNWRESSENKLLQEKFWRIFPSKATFSDTGKPLHGEIEIKIGSKFLSKYQYLFNETIN